MGGMKVKEFEMGPLLFKRLKIEGSTLRSRDLQYQSQLVQDFVKARGVDRIVDGIKSESEKDSGHHLAIHKVGRGESKMCCRVALTHHAFERYTRGKTLSRLMMK
jgi:hypothetical protein